MKNNRVRLVGIALTPVITSFGIKFWYGTTDLMVLFFAACVFGFLESLFVIRKINYGLVILPSCVVGELALFKYESLYLASLALAAICFAVYYAVYGILKLTYLRQPEQPSRE